MRLPSTSLLLAAIVTATACGDSGERAGGDPPVTADEPSCYDTVAPTGPLAPPDALPNGDWNEGETLRLDLASCVGMRWHVWLGLGSAWVAMAPGADSCEVWLGGEGENPLYDGSATQYCRFLRNACEAEVQLPGDWGPAFIDSPACSDR